MSQQLAIVTPADVDQIIQMLKAFDDFKNKALSKNDYAVIKGKKSVKRSGWSKYAVACNVSTELREERVEERDGHRIYHFVYRAIHLPSGRYADAAGSASEKEKSEEEWNHPEHDVRSLAQTRAYNRAISNLVGGGEISAEELSTDDRTGASRPPPSQQQTRSPPEAPKPSEELTDQIESVMASAGFTKVRVYPYGKRVYVEALDIEQDEWPAYNAILTPLGAAWNRESGRWEILAEE